MLCLFFEVWVILFNVLGSINFIFLPFLMIEENPIVHMYHNFIINLSIDGHLGLVYFLAIMNISVMHKDVQVSPWCNI